MPKWTDYTIKTTVADNDEVMTLDTAGKANKRLSLSILSDWVLGKIADKVFAKLQTNDKTILGAINELNSKANKGTMKLLSYDNSGNTVDATFSVSVHTSCNLCIIRITPKVCILFLNGYNIKIIGYSMIANVKECSFSGNGLNNIKFTIKFGKDNYLTESECNRATVTTLIE